MSKEAIKQLNKAIVWVAKEFSQIMKRVVKIENYDTWQHHRSIKYKKLKDLESTVYSDQIQAPVSEFGRKPWKAPPFDALVGWVIRKLWKPWSPKWRYGDQPHETQRAIRRIAEKIGREGIKAKHIYTYTAEDNDYKLLLALKRNVW